MRVSRKSSDICARGEQGLASFFLHTVLPLIRCRAPLRLCQQPLKNNQQPQGSVCRGAASEGPGAVQRQVWSSARRGHPERTLRGALGRGFLSLSSLGGGMRFECFPTFVFPVLDGFAPLPRFRLTGLLLMFPGAGGRGDLYFLVGRHILLVFQ